jgi:hypothetical protein
MFSQFIYDLRSAVVLFGMSLNGFCAGQFHGARGRPNLMFWEGGRDY